MATDIPTFASTSADLDKLHLIGCSQTQYGQTAYEAGVRENLNCVDCDLIKTIWATEPPPLEPENTLAADIRRERTDELDQA